jgi:hypothetical protein
MSHRFWVLFFEDDMFFQGYQHSLGEGNKRGIKHSKQWEKHPLLSWEISIHSFFD